MSDSMELAPMKGLRPQRKIPNTIVFPKELREAIPEHSARVLEFDRVSGDTTGWWGGLYASGVFQKTARARLSLLAHETGKLTGQYEIGLDLDAETMRALGQFLIQLAERAEAEQN